MCESRGDRFDRCQGEQQADTLKLLRGSQPRS
jgi:hypothetical protein